MSSASVKDCSLASYRDVFLTSDEQLIEEKLVDLWDSRTDDEGVIRLDSGPDIVVGKGLDSGDRIRPKRKGRMNDTLLTMNVVGMISIMAREDTGELDNTMSITKMNTPKGSVVIVDMVPRITFY